MTMTMTTDAWMPEPRDVPVELEPDFDHETFPPKPVYFPPISERLPEATVRQLMEMAHGKAPDPE